MAFDSIITALDAIRIGRMVILVDDEDRENEGDLCCAAERITPETINFMATHGRGLICLTLTEERLHQLQIPMMVAENTSAYGTAFTVSIEARHGVSTGISAADRSHTIRVAVDPASTPHDLVRPGHVFPLKARRGGVLVRTGQTEGSVDLARLAGLQPAGVICEIMKNDGTMARLQDLRAFALTHDMPIVSVADIIQYRLAHESLVQRRTSRAVVHPLLGPVTVHVYGTNLDDREHLVVVKGSPQEGCAPLVRVQSQHSTSDAFGSVLHDDHPVRTAVVKALQAAPHGVWVCLDRGLAPPSLTQRVEALGETFEETWDANCGILREVGIGAQILRDCGLHHIRLLTRDTKRLAGLDGYGLVIDETVQLDVASPPSADATHAAPRRPVLVGVRS